MMTSFIVHLWGGLGNQLFQFAFGLAKSKRHGMPLALETRKGDRNFAKLNSFVELNDFEVLEVNVIRSGIIGFIKKAFMRVLPAPRRLKLDHNFSPSMAGPIKGRFVGYWQSESYFLDQTPHLKKHISLERISLDGVSSNILSAVRSSGSVAVHVRRGDYLRPIHKGRYSSVNESYYGMAMNLSRKLVPGAHFIFFSDDSDWVEELYGGIPDVLVARGNSDLQDLRLMSECRHQIIANSTFSWWASWLNRNPDKLVFMPRKWFNTPHCEFDDIYMKGAIILNP